MALPALGAWIVGRWVWGVLSVASAPLRRGAPIGVVEALLACVAALALATLLWLALGMLLETLAQVPGEVGRAAARASAAVSPLVVRRAAAVVLGASLSAALSPAVSMAATGASVAASIGVSASPTPGTPATPGERSSGAFDGGAPALPDPGFAPLPDPGFAPPSTPGVAPTTEAEPFVAEPPVVRAQPDVRVLAPADRRTRDLDPAGEVVVHRGDSLWSIAARHLGRDPSDAEIAREWPRWYAANAVVIGADPDLLLPGQVLIAPEGSRP